MTISLRYLFWLALPLTAVGAADNRSTEYGAVQARLARGWNTWDVHSVAAQVLLPDGFTIRFGLKHRSTLDREAFLGNALIGRIARPGEDAEVVEPGPHTWNGSYTELRLTWHRHRVLLQTAHDGDDLVMLASPLGGPNEPAAEAVFSTGVLWNRDGAVTRQTDHFEFANKTRTIPVYWTATEETFADLPVTTPFVSALLSQPFGISTGRHRSVAEILAVLDRGRPKAASTAQAIETVLGWDTIYEPSHERVLSPVSRQWCLNWGGYVLFDWDTYFAASLAASGNRDLAYANAIEITREATPAGFVPNYARTGGWKSFDRSEPPVGAITVHALFRQFHDSWLVRDTFDALLAWNRWWAERRDFQGYLVWGTDAGNRPANPDDGSVGTKQGAVYESGLDNSPMYDDAPFAAGTGRLLQADVGLMGLYVADCDALANMADLLEKKGEAAELRARAQRYREKLQSLWDEKSGIFLNKNLETGQFNRRLSPTNFYPMLAKAATPAQADRMVREHLLNPAEFWGEWALPSIARSDAAFKEQNYWRGRIWGPMNYLVYLGLRNYEQSDARRQLGQRSLALFDREWKERGHVHENYNAITGDGDDVASSDRFYHWGALLGLVDLQENPPQSR